MMNRTKRQRVMDGIVHWSIAAAIATALATFVIEKAVRNSRADVDPISVVVEQKNCRTKDCYIEIKRQLAEIEKRLDDAEPVMTGSAPK